MSENNEENGGNPVITSEVEKLQDELAQQVVDSISTGFDLSSAVGQGFVRSSGVLFHREGEEDRGTPVLSLMVTGPHVPQITQLLREAGINIQFDRVTIPGEDAPETESKEETPDEEEAGEESAT